MDHLPFYTRQDRLKAGLQSLNHSYVVQVLGDYGIQRATEETIKSMIEQYHLVLSDDPKDLGAYVRKNKTGHETFNEISVNFERGLARYKQLVYTSRPYSSLNKSILNAERDDIRRLYSKAFEDGGLTFGIDKDTREIHSYDTDSLSQYCDPKLFDESEFGVLKPFALPDGRCVEFETPQITPPEIDWGLG